MPALFPGALEERVFIELYGVIGSIAGVADRAFDNQRRPSLGGEL